MNKIIKVNTLAEQQTNKSKENIREFNKFIKNCKDEIKENKNCVCFSLEQINELKKKFNLKYVEKDGFYYVEVVEK